MKRLGSGFFGRPEAIFFEEVIGKDDELSHDGGQGEFLDLSSGQEALVEALEMLVEARRRKGRHIDTVAHGLAAAPDAARAVALTAVAGDGGEPCESGLLGAKTAKLGHVGNQPASCHGSHAWNGEEDGEPAREGRIAFDGLNGQFFKHVSRGFSAFDLTFDLAPDACDSGGRKLVSKRCPRRQGRLTVSHDFTQVFNGFGQRRRCRELGHQAERGEHPRIDGVGFRQRAKQLGEEPGAQRIDDGDGKPSIVQEPVDAAMIFARRLHDHDPHPKRLEGGQELLVTFLDVGKTQNGAGREDVDVEPLFTNVDSHAYFIRRAVFGHDLALHPGLAPNHLFRTSAKDRRTKLTHGSCQGAYGPADPSLQTPAGVWRDAQILADSSKIIMQGGLLPAMTARRRDCQETERPRPLL